MGALWFKLVFQEPSSRVFRRYWSEEQRLRLGPRRMCPPRQSSSTSLRPTYMPGTTVAVGLTVGTTVAVALGEGDGVGHPHGRMPCAANWPASEFGFTRHGFLLGDATAAGPTD